LAIAITPGETRVFLNTKKIGGKAELVEDFMAYSRYILTTTQGAVAFLTLNEMTGTNRRP
jgi:hypothetical protein